MACSCIVYMSPRYQYGVTSADADGCGRTRQRAGGAVEQQLASDEHEAADSRFASPLFEAGKDTAPGYADAEGVLAPSTIGLLAMERASMRAGGQKMHASALIQAKGRQHRKPASKFAGSPFSLSQPLPYPNGKALPGDALVELSSEELASDERKAANSRIRQTALAEAERGQHMKTATTDQFQCGKCRQRKCQYYQMQTRSADEPMTTFVTCVNCGNRWKFC